MRPAAVRCCYSTRRIAARYSSRWRYSSVPGPVGRMAAAVPKVRVLVLRPQWFTYRHGGWRHPVCVLEALAAVLAAPAVHASTHG